MKLELQKGSRSRILAGLIFAIVGVFIIRLFYLQIIQHNYYVDLADNEQVKILTFPAKRGLIYALDGTNPVPLVLNQTVYTVIADPFTTDADDKIVDTIQKVAGGNARSNLKGLLSNKESRYAVLATKITRTQAEKIKAENFKGVILREDTQRVYPENSLAAQVLGFVNDDGKGQYGIEGKLNDELAGKPGLLKTVVDVSNVPLSIGDKNIDEPAVNGKNVVLTIDRNIQSYTEQALARGLERTGATEGSVVVLDPQSGKVMAMANLPTYNPGEYSKVEDASVFNNGVISDPYEPASVIKTLTFFAGIEKGVITPNSTYNNTDHIQVDDRIISNASLGQTGIITFQHALDWSLNTGAVTIAERLGDGNNITRQAREILYDYFVNKFGLGKETGIELAGENAGEVVPPDDVRGNAVRYSNMTFGQGLDVTVLQVASAFSAIINDGKYYKPTVIAGTMNADGTYEPNATPQPIRVVPSESTSAQMREMTHVTRINNIGNADKPGYYLGGKTGTAETIVDGRYNNSQTIASYVGFGGTDTPRYVIMVKLFGKNKALRGAQEAGPVFTDISNWLIDYLKLQPKG